MSACAERDPSRTQVSAKRCADTDLDKKFLIYFVYKYQNFLIDIGIHYKIILIA